MQGPQHATLCSVLGCATVPDGRMKKKSLNFPDKPNGAISRDRSNISFLSTTWWSISILQKFNYTLSETTYIFFNRRGFTKKVNLMYQEGLQTIG
jgi:hypothetical protein